MAAQDSLPTAGQALSGWIGYQQGRYERFQLFHIPLSQAYLARYAYYYFCSTLMPKKDNCNAVDKDMPSDVCRRPYISFPLKVEIKLDAQTAFSTIISLIVMPLIPIVPQLDMVFTPLNVLRSSPTMCLPFTVIF